MDEIMKEYLFLIWDLGSKARVFNSNFIALQLYETLFTAPLCRVHHSLLRSVFSACNVSLLHSVSHKLHPIFKKKKQKKKGSYQFLQDVAIL